MSTTASPCIRVDEPILEKPNAYDEEQGWIRTDIGVLEPVWACGPVLPNTLVDLLDIDDREEEEEEEEQEEEEEDEVEFDFDHLSGSDSE